MALSKIDVANMLTGVTPVANGGTALSSGFTNGKIGQVLQDVHDTQAASTSTSYADVGSGGVTKAITCSATSSKVLIIGTLNGYIESDNHLKVRLMRDSTVIEENINYFHSQGTNVKGIAGAMSFIDSPSSTSELTYKFQFCSRDSGETVRICGDHTPSNIILMEILAWLEIILKN